MSKLPVDVNTVPETVKKVTNTNKTDLNETCIKVS